MKISSNSFFVNSVLTKFIIVFYVTAHSKIVNVILAIKTEFQWILMFKATFDFISDKICLKIS